MPRHGAGGVYHGKLLFPAAYPFKPPSILMLTPNGRFAVNQRLCLSMSDYHPESWNRACLALLHNAGEAPRDALLPALTLALTWRVPPLLRCASS